MALLSERYADDGKATYELSDIQRKYIDIYTEKCKSGVYTFRDRSCECGHTDFEIIGLKDRYGLPVSTVICKNCGLIMTSPCLSDESNNSFYDNEYHYIYRNEDKPSDRMFLSRKAYAMSNLVPFIRAHGGPGEGSMLEIGCADGGNVAAFKEFGYKATGIDLSHTYVEYGKSQGLDLYCSDSTSFSENGTQYDLVFINHVVEHFTDLQKEFNTIRKLLKDDGCLFIGVPGVRYMTFGAYKADFLRMLQNAHIFNFTKTSLCRVMAKYGFSGIFCSEYIQGLFKKDPDALKKIEEYNEYREIRDYLQLVEDSAGDIPTLLIARSADKLASFGSGEVILYGTAEELDAFTQHIPDLSPVKGFFYSDKKTPKEVADFVNSLGCDQAVKCLILIDSKNNKTLKNGLVENLNIDCDTEIFSLYSED